jgi:hypothetical protein
MDKSSHADREARYAMELTALIVVPVQPDPNRLWATEAALFQAQAE